MSSPCHVRRRGWGLEVGFILVSAALLATCWGAVSAGADERPQEILSWRHQILSSERYEELVKEWEAYASTHPKDPRAWVEWGDALRYTGKREEAKEKYKRAFEIDSSDVAALVKYTENVTIDKHATTDWSLAKKRLLRASKMEPAFHETYYSLWTAALRTGDESLAATCLRRMVELGDMPKPLFDFGHNMIAGAPENAIIFTNGDNDTYPPLAFQVITGERSDVFIVNLSLLNTKWFIKYIRDKGVPIGLDDEAIDKLQHGKEERIAHQMQQRIFDNLKKKGWPRPLFYCVTVAEGNKALDCRCVTEGLLQRILPPTGAAEAKAHEINLARSRELFDTVYRLDSITDPLIDWERESSVARLGTNYPALLHMVGTELLRGETPSSAGPYLYRAISILSFHHREGLARGMLEEWKSADPGSELLAKAQSLLDSP